MPKKGMTAWTDELPVWASLNLDDGYVEVDPAIVYPYWLGKMEELDPSLKGISDSPTQCALEVARFLFTRSLKKLMYDGGGKFLNLRILKDPEWALRRFPKGTPINRRLFYPKLGLQGVLG